MARDSQRIFILVIVAVFLLSTLAFTGVVIYSIIGGGNDEATSELSQSEIQEMLEEQENTEPEEGALEGTQLEGFEPVTGTVDELQIIDITEGEGKAAEKGGDVVAHYTGALANSGVIFQSSHDTGEPIPFNLDGVIQGWGEGVPGMKEGGTRRLIIPAEKAYGDAPEGYSYAPGQQPLGPLVFDIELVEVQ